MFLFNILKSILFYVFILLAIVSEVLSAQGEPERMINDDRIEIRKGKQKSIEKKLTEEQLEQKADLLSQKRNELIVEIQNAWGENLEQSQKINLGLRLGRLYLEDYYDQNSRSVRKPSGSEEQRKFETGAAASLDKSSKLYIQLYTLSPADERADEMLFYLATVSLAMSKDEEAVQFFNRLIVKYPKSHYFYEANFQLAEFYYQKGSYDNAEKFYSVLIDNRFIPLISYAAYKRGWCAYHLGKEESAFKSFDWVIQNEPKIAVESRLRIRDEAINDIVTPITVIKTPKEVSAYFAQFEIGKQRSGLEKAANLWNLKNEYDSAIALWKILLTIEGTEEEHSQYEVSILTALKSSNQIDLAVKRVLDRAPSYVDAKARKGRKILAPVYAKWEEVFRGYGIYLHYNADKIKDKEIKKSYLENAKLLYVQYLEYFTQSIEVNTIRSSLANLYFQEGEYFKASELYEIVAIETKDPKIKKESYVNSLVALNRLLNPNGHQGVLFGHTQKGAQFTPYNSVENKFIRMVGEFEELYPSDKETSEFLYDQAFLEYRHQDLTNSYNHFTDLIKKFNQYSNLTDVAYLMVDILNQKESYERLVKLCEVFLAQNFGDKEFKTRIADVMRRSEIKRIAVIEEAGQYEIAAKQYLNYSNRFGNDDLVLHEAALYNAGVCYTKAKQFPDALIVKERLLETFPNSKWEESLLPEMASSYEKSGNLKKAAEYYLKFTERFPKNAQSKIALRWAALFSIGANDLDKGESLLLIYYNRYPEDSAFIESDLLDLYQVQGDVSKEVAWHYKLLNSKKLSIPDFFMRQFKWVEAVSRQKGGESEDGADKLYKFALQNSKELSKNLKTIDKYAQILLWGAAKKEEAFHRYSLSDPKSKIERTLKIKMDILKNLKDEWMKVVALGSPKWAQVALYKTVALQHLLINEIRTATVPAELSPEELEIYRAELEKSIIAPLITKSKSLVESCLKIESEVETMLIVTGKCFAIAGQLDSVTFQPIRTAYLPPTQFELIDEIEKNNKKNHKQMKGKLLFSSFYPEEEGNREIASLSHFQKDITGAGIADVSDSRFYIPHRFNFGSLNVEQRESMKMNLKDIKEGEKYTFDELNQIRFTDAKTAVHLIAERMRWEPENEALQNLLGVALMDAKNYLAAKAMWLSMIARNKAVATAYNNLGVLMSVLGKEDEAIAYFKEAAIGKSETANLNLGFIALKFRNSKMADLYFAEALKEVSGMPLAQSGKWVAELQDRKFKGLSKQLVASTKSNPSDAFLRLITSYYLIDKEKKYDMAERLLSQQLDGNEMKESGYIFERTLAEAREELKKIKELRGKVEASTPIPEEE